MTEPLTTGKKEKMTFLVKPKKREKGEGVLRAGKERKKENGSSLREGEEVKRTPQLAVKERFTTSILKKT